MKSVGCNSHMAQPSQVGHYLAKVYILMCIWQIQYELERRCTDIDLLPLYNS